VRSNDCLYASVVFRDAVHTQAVLAPASKGNDPPVFFRFLGVIQPSKKTRDESLAVGILEPQTAFSPSDVPVGIVVPLRMIEAMESKDVGTRFEHNSPLFPNLRQFQTFWNDTPPIINGSDTLRATDYLPDIEVSFPKAAWYERCAPFFSIELAVSGSRSEPKYLDELSAALMHARVEKCSSYLCVVGSRWLGRTALSKSPYLDRQHRHRRKEHTA